MTSTLLVASIVVALSLASCEMSLRRGRPHLQRALRQARLLDTAAWSAYLVHVAVALLAVHGSHSAAYAHTARRTAEWIGLETGAGLYLNYLFTLAWSWVTLRSWFTPLPEPAPRAGWRRAWFDGTLLFMTLNGAVIFASPIVRLWGLVVVLSICWIIYRNEVQRSAIR